MSNLVTTTVIFIKENDMVMEYEDLPAGEHEARLIYVAELGKCINKWAEEGKDNIQNKMSLCFEVIGSSVKIDGVEKPRMLWCPEFNHFDHNLTEMGRETERYKVFVPDAQKGMTADWKSVLGEPVSIRVIKDPNKKDPSKVFDVIDSITPIPAKYKDKVAPAITTDFAMATAEDLDSPAIKNLFGLTKWRHDNRLRDNTGNTKPIENNNTSKPQPVVEEEVFDEAVPF